MTTDPTVLPRLLILDKLYREGPIRPANLKRSVLRRYRSMKGCGIPRNLWPDVLGELMEADMVHLTDNMDLDRTGKMRGWEP